MCFINNVFLPVLFKCFTAVVNTIEGKDCCEAMNAIVESGIVTEEKLSHIIAGMFGLLKEALRLPKSSLKHEVIKSW